MGRLLTYAQVGEMLGLARETIRRKVRQRQLPACRIGTKTVRIPEAVVQKLIEESFVPAVMREPTER